MLILNFVIILGFVYRLYLSLDIAEKTKLKIQNSGYLKTFWNMQTPKSIEPYLYNNRALISAGQFLSLDFGHFLIVSG